MPESDTAIGIKKTTRRKSVKTTSPSLPSNVDQSDVPIKKISEIMDIFEKLIAQINQEKNDYEALLKKIKDTRENWLKEKLDLENAINERNNQTEIQRKRTEETYQYEFSLRQKRAEDEFKNKLEKWERDLAERKEELARENQELEFLRKQVNGFETEKDKAIKEANNILQKDLVSQFQTEKNLLIQKHQSEINLLELKISNLTAENSRQTKEIDILRKSLENATRELKEVAVKIIESGNTSKSAGIQSE